MALEEYGILGLENNSSNSNDSKLSSAGRIL